MPRVSASLSWRVAKRLELCVKRLTEGRPLMNEDGIARAFAAGATKGSRLAWTQGFEAIRK